MRVLTRPHYVVYRTLPYIDQIERAKILHQQDLASGHGDVYLPYALERKYPHADREWNWQYVFPAANRSIAPRTKFKRRFLSKVSSLRALW